MPLSSVSPHAPRFEVLTATGMARIDEAVLRVLDKTGIDFPNAQAQELFRAAGARVNGDRVRIPGELLRDSVRLAPSSVTLFDRKGKAAMLVEGYESHFGTSGTTPYVFDPVSGQRKRSTRRSIGDVARLCDALPQIEWTMPLGVPSDVHRTLADRFQFYEAVRNQSKPLYSSAYTAAGLRDVIAMASIIAGGTDRLRASPFFFTGIDPSSPLRYGSEVVAKLLVMAEAGLPIILNPMPMAGGTTPATMAGTIVVALAEGLAGTMLAQLCRRGTPVIVGGVLSPMDMRTTVVTFGAPELSLMMSAMAQMCRYYRVPSYGTAGCSNSKVIDAQAALEMTHSLLTSTLAGSNLIHDLGVVDTGMTVSLEGLVLADEVAAEVRRIAGGLPVDDDNLALDVLEKVGPGGHFIAEEHTYRHFREHHQSKLIDRRNYDGWLADGAKSMVERLHERVLAILSTHVPEPLPTEVDRELARMMDRWVERT